MNTEEMTATVLERDLTESAGNSMAKCIAPFRPRGTKFPEGKVTVEDFEFVGETAADLYALQDVDQSDLDELC